MRRSVWMWTRLLLTVDRLCGTRLVERELARRERSIERLLAQIDTVNRDLDALGEELVVYRLAICLIELKARSERDDVDDWLRFAPHRDGEEALLDSAIEYLVKHRLAAIDAQADGPSHYVYRLYPDWAAIAGRLREKPVAQELIKWLGKQSRV